MSWRPLENTLPPHWLHDLICSNISAKPSKNKRGFVIILHLIDKLLNNRAISKITRSLFLEVRLSNLFHNLGPNSIPLTSPSHPPHIPVTSPSTATHVSANLGVVSNPYRYIRVVWTWFNLRIYNRERFCFKEEKCLLTWYRWWNILRGWFWAPPGRRDVEKHSVEGKEDDVF